jgi:glycine/D-amino acid oxidase-like deaminating enzyme
MDLDSGATRSVWLDGIELGPTTPLTRSISTDVCVVGAGIAGLTTAYLLSREGLKVIVIDDGPLCGGETGRTTAHLANEIDDSYQEIESLHGRDGARLVAQSHTAAIDLIERIVQQENIDCDFVRLGGFLFNPANGDTSFIDKEFEAARRAGLNPERLLHAPLPFATGACLRFPDQGKFHILKYLSGVVAAIQRNEGSVIYIHQSGRFFGRFSGAGANRTGTHDRSTSSGRCDQLAHQQPLRAPHKTDGVQNVRARSTRSGRQRRRGFVLGHA